MFETKLSQRTVRLFPLSSFVFFPHSRVPLRVFEPRYKQMVRDALATDREIAIVLPKGNDSSVPVPLHSVATLGRIRNERRDADGDILLDLVGVSRVRLIQEVSNVKLYREARVEMLVDTWSSRENLAYELQRAEILRHFKAVLSPEEEVAVEFLRFLTHDCHGGAFPDVIAYASPIPLEIKQKLLEETSVSQRMQMLVSLAHAVLPHVSAEETISFPPVLSLH